MKLASIKQEVSSKQTNRKSSTCSMCFPLFLGFLLMLLSQLKERKNRISKYSWIQKENQSQWRLFYIFLFLSFLKLFLLDFLQFYVVMKKLHWKRGEKRKFISFLFVVCSWILRANELFATGPDRKWRSMSKQEWKGFFRMRISNLPPTTVNRTW